MSLFTSTKDMIKGFFHSFFKTFAIILGVLFAFALMTALFHAPTGLPHSTSFTVVPNANWEVKPFSKTTPIVLKISLHGPIGIGSLTGDSIRNILIDSVSPEMKEAGIKAIFLSIDSPGGSASDSDMIYRLITEYKKKHNIPVYCYTESIMASGGMLSACSADKIFASDAALVGHVGVIIPTAFNFTKLMDKIGVESTTIFAGKNKDDLNPFRPWRPDEQVHIQQLVNSYYERFTSIVTENRKQMTKEQLIKEGAEILPSQDAKAKGYIDEIVNSEDVALLELVKQAGIEDNYQVIEFQNENWLANIFGEESLFKKELTIRLPGDIEPKFYGKPLYLYHPQK